MILFALQWNEIFATLTAAAAHELGHISALMLFGSPPRGIVFSLTGPVLIYQELDSAGKKLIAALSGPIIGLLLASILQRVWPECAKISLLLSLVNLLPVLPLDGGRALRALLTGRYMWLLCLFDILIPLGVMLLSLALIRDGQNGFWMLMFGVWLLILSCQEQ